MIYAVEKIEPYCSFLAPLWPAAQAGRVSIVTSELTWLETLVKPMRDGNTALELLFRAFLTAREVRLVPATLPIWEHAARLRALGLKTPDAAFARVPGLPVTALSAAISS